MYDEELLGCCHDVLGCCHDVQLSVYPKYNIQYNAKMKKTKHLPYLALFGVSL